MEIENWFKNGCDYEEGISLYATLKGHSKNLVRLFCLKDSPRNREKLKYELEKHRTESAPVLSMVEDNSQPKVNLQVNSEAKKSNQHFYRLNQLPLELHPLAIKQRSDYQTAISLKLQLNDLHPDEEGVALELCLQIENLFDSIEEAQKILSYYIEHKVVLDVSPRDFNSLTPAQLVKRQLNKRSSITKLKGRIKGYHKKLATNLPLAEQTKTNTQLQKTTERLMQHQLELQQLNEMINNK
ncbi:hypothetical protein HCG49_17005 [Arenibacter sp. 6A1]|uniref:hypothetical protein n=1 Tax=Arenibacter sp. 6A1 TaxID=2720391 RepID=UPI0014459FA6|nr:hypothetical protein [Arenibacter sp. 6A1]NKI28255.1 hypothetical protein [Arenibacter sp. 6A1]